MAGTVKVTFIGDSANLKKHLKEVVKQTDDSNNAFGRLGVASGKMGGALKAITPSAQTLAIGFAAMTAGAVIFGKKSVDAYNESLAAQTKLSTNLLNVKGNTEANVKSIQKLAGELQKKGVIDDDAITAGAAQLATFALQGKTIEKLTPKIADMAAQMHGSNTTGEDMVKINNLVGKVMTGNVGALSRYGVSLSETQKKQLKNGNEAERAAILVEVLGQNYGKVNEALAKTPEGQLTILKNRFGELQEQIGNVLVKALVPMMGFVVDTAIPWMEKMWASDGMQNFISVLSQVWVWIKEKLWPATLEAGKVLIEVLGVAFRWIGKAIKWAIPYVERMVDSFRKAWPQIAAFFKDAWENVIKPLWDAFVKAIKLVWRIFQDAWPAIQTILKVAAIVIGAVLMGIYWTIKNVLVPVITFLVDAMSKAWTVISTVIGVAWAIIKPIWDVLYAVIANVIVPVIQLLWAIGSVIFKAIGDAISAMWNVIKPVLEPFIAIWEVLRSAMLSAWGWIEDNILPKIEKILGWVKSFTETLKDSIDAIREFFGLENQMLTGFAKNTDEQVKRELEGKAKETVDKIIKAGNIDAESIGQKDPNSKPAEWNPKTKKWEAKKALGGPVMAGMPYKVGEGGGPELFVPSTNGNIVNARDTRSMGATYNVQIYPQKVDLNDRDLIATLKRFESLHAA